MIYLNRCKLFFAFLIGFNIATLNAQALIPAAPDLGAKSWVLIDATTGKILTGNNINQQIAPASLTKMMTSYIAAEEIAEGRLTLDQELTVSTNAWRKGGAKTGGSTMFLNEKSSVTVEDLLYGLVVQSGNDAAIVLAEHIGGTEDNFADMMNQQATLLGMENTNFSNSTGWPDVSLYSSAYDMALLAQALIQNHPEHYTIYSEKSFTYNGISQRNRNSLLWQDNSVDGLKTGHTKDAGYCLVASALRNDMRLISVVMGAGSTSRRLEASKKLLAWGFRYFRTRTLYEPNVSLQSQRLWKGLQGNINIGLLEPITLTLPRSASKNINAEFTVNNYIEAPIDYGDILGAIKITMGNDVVYEGDLISLESVGQSPFYQRLWDSIRYFFLSIME